MDTIQGLLGAVSGSGVAATMGGDVFVVAAQKVGLPTDTNTLNKIVDLVNRGYSPDQAAQTVAGKNGLLSDPAQITKTYKIAPAAKALPMSAEQESRFQQDIQQSPWFKEFAQQYGESPDLNTPDYNYRAAWQAGVRPEVYEFDQKYHWPSVTPDGQSLKAVNHPTAWMEDYMQVTGRDPHEGGMLSVDQIKAISKALRYRYGK